MDAKKLKKYFLIGPENLLFKVIYLNFPVVTIKIISLLLLTSESWTTYTESISDNVG